MIVKIIIICFESCIFGDIDLINILWEKCQTITLLIQLFNHNYIFN